MEDDLNILGGPKLEDNLNFFGKWKTTSLLANGRQAPACPELGTAQSQLFDCILFLLVY